jgi:transcriptional regulator with XRE-family HTH domain
MVSNSTSLGAQIRQLRSDREWTQAQLAEAAGFDTATISDYERDMHTLTVRSLLRLAGALAVPPVALLRSVNFRLGPSDIDSSLLTGDYSAHALVMIEPAGPYDAEAIAEILQQPIPESARPEVLAAPTQSPKTWAARQGVCA